MLVLGSLILVGGRWATSSASGGCSRSALPASAWSLVCAIAPTIEVLVGGRALQGMFGALLTPSALAVIVATFPPGERGGAIGSWTAWTGIGAIAGPLGRRRDHRPRVVALDLRHQRPVRDRDARRRAGRGARARARRPARRVDWLGGLLCALGLAGPVVALIRQPELGWSAPGVVIPMLAGVAFLALFLWHEARTPDPMLPLSLFRRRNFAVGNAETLTIYAGLSVLFFFLVVFLQQVAGWSALDAGLATLPTTIVMFVMSRHTGALADRYGPRMFMGGGPLVAACGLLLMQRIGADPDYLTDVLPALLVFALGLSLTVAPLTATVLADADESNAGIASGVNNAIARVAGLLGVAAIGAVVAAQFDATLDRSSPPSAEPGRAAGGRRGAVADARPSRAGRRAGERAGRDRLGDRGCLGRRVPPRPGHLGGARRERRPARLRRDQEPAALRLRGGVRGRPARGRPTRGGASSGARAGGGGAGGADSGAGAVGRSRRRYAANSVSSGSRSPRSTARSTSTHASPRDSASTRACGLMACAARTPRQSPIAGSMRMRSR